MRWHYITGAIFGVIVVTWAMSGLFSLNPGQLNPSRSPSAAQKALIRGQPLPLQAYRVPASAGSSRRHSRELSITQYRSQPLWFATRLNGERSLRSAHELREFERPDVITLAKLAPDLMPGVPVLRQHLLTRYDDYYYARHPEGGENPFR